MTISQAELALAVMYFNLLPVRGMDVSWRPELFPENLLPYLFTPECSEKHLSAHILKTLHLESSIYFDESWTHWPLVLAPENILADYAKVCGGLLLRHVLQHTIAREHVLYYRQQLGNLYPFILEKGPLLYPRPATIFAFSPEQLIGKMQQFGWLTLRQAATLFPEAVTKRFMLKIPYEITTLPVDDIALSAQQALTLLTHIRYEMDAK